MPDLNILYVILRQFAQQHLTRTYCQLSEAYRDRTKVWFEPHGSWDWPLDEINKRLDAATPRRPPISAVIINQETRHPGGGFWGCCSRTHRVLRNNAERGDEHIMILNEVYDTDWPAHLP